MTEKAPETKKPQRVPDEVEEALLNDAIAKGQATKLVIDGIVRTVYHHRQPELGALNYIIA